MEEAMRESMLAWLRFARVVHGGSCRCGREAIEAEQAEFEKAWNGAFDQGKRAGYRGAAFNVEESAGIWESGGKLEEARAVAAAAKDLHALLARLL